MSPGWWRCPPTLPSGTSSFGSGYVVGPGLVLTARHLVCGDDGTLHQEVVIRTVTDGTLLRCQVAWAGRADLDAALLRCDGLMPLAEPVRWGQLVASDAADVQAAGFPRSMEQPGGLREVESLRGQVSPGTGVLGGRLYVDVTGARPRAGLWNGMCGAAVQCGSLLVGVVAWNVLAFDGGRLAAEPVTRLFDDPGFRALVGEDVAVEAAELAAPRLRIPAQGPADLLRAEFRTARFRSRTSELARLAAWCDGPGVGVRLLTGPGGQGKTRLALELTGQLSAAREWVSQEWHATAKFRSRIRTPLLIWVDYAETRPAQVQELILAALSEPRHVRIRVLLIARSADDWWDRLRISDAQLEMALRGTIVDELAPLENTPAGRQQAFSEAVQDYARSLETMYDCPHVTPTDITVPDLRDSRFASALRLQMTALATLLDGSYNGTVPPEAVILTHEERYWQRAATEHGLNLTRDTLRCGVTAAALCGAASQAQAVAILSHVPGLRDQTEDVRLRAARWLRDLYQPLADPLRSEPRPERYWGSLQPDLLAEHLAASVVDAVPDFLPGLLSDCTPEQGQQALTVLARAAGSRPGMAAPLTDLLAQLPDLAPAAVIGSTRSGHPAPLITALTVLADSHGLPASLLSAVFDVIPEQTRALNGLAIAITRHLVATFERLAEASPDTYLADVAVWQNNLPVRLADAGQQEKALAAIERAVTVYERLAEATPGVYLPSLARSLNNLSVRLGAVGQREEAVAAIRRAVAIREQLALASPGGYRPDLATSLNNLSVLLADVGQREEALAAIQRATAIREQLAAADPDAYLPDLAASLNNLSLRLGAMGRVEEGLAASRRTVTIHEQLADESPDAYLADLARALTNLSALLAEAGQRDEALSEIQRAVEVYEQLAEAIPDAYLPKLASSLDNLSVLLSRVGRQEKGLAVSRRTVAIWEQLAGASPDAYLRNLAAALNNLSNRLGSAGQRQDGLAAGQRAAGIYEQLAKASPDAYLPDLAKLLANLSAWLGDAGRMTEAVAAGQRAVTIGEQLTAADSVVYLPGLAASLNNLSNQLSKAGRLEEALEPIQRAAGINEQLAKAMPDAYVPELASSLNNLSLRLGDAGRQEEALAAIQRAAGIYGRLAEAKPDVYRPGFASSLNNLSVRLGDAGRREEALTAIQRAVAIREELTAISPEVYRPDLATSLNNLAQRLAEAGHWEKALAAMQRVLEIYEPLAEASPDAYLPALAMSLNNLSVLLGITKRQGEALAAIQGAVTIRRKLAERYPEAFEPDLALSLVALADQLFAAGEYVAAMESLINAAGLAERRNRQDLVSRVVQRLRQAHQRQPAVVAAEYERLTGGPWPS
jgi:tetratricopeptide (TPR) repeat protein